MMDLTCSRHHVLSAAVAVVVAAGLCQSPPARAAEKGGPPAAALPAFAGAQGAGATTPGGRGGTVYKVTSLADYGEDEQPIAGTLRHAVEQAGPRTVVFAVGGTLRLKRPLIITEPYLTVAGNTAPFPGVMVTAYPTAVRADHVILRYLRFRLDVAVMRQRFAQEKDSGWDSLGATRCENVIFDHLSGSHSVDETISFSGEVDDVTLSHSIMAYSLRSVFHDYYFSRGPNDRLTRTHNLGGLVAYLGKHDSHAMASSHHNVWAHHDRRMPGMSAGRGDPKNLISYIDIRSSVMYNWKSNAAGIETGDVDRSRYHMNFVGNYLKPGPTTPGNRRYAGLTVMGFNRVYLEANVHHAFARKDQPTPQKKLLLDRGRLPAGQSRLLDKPLPTPAVATELPPTLAQLANQTVGASIPCRDSVDHRTIRDIFEGTGHHPFADMDKNTAPPLPALPTVRHVYASDDDPFPIWWKLAQGLAAGAAIDPLADADGDGYTNIEAYMHGLPLRAEAVDWTQPKNNRNPLAAAEPYDLPLDVGLPAKVRGWTNDAGTVHATPRGLFVMAGSVGKVDGQARGVWAIVDDSPDYWAAGRGDDAVAGPAGARHADGPALVLAFVAPQRLTGIRIARPHPDIYAAAHDPARVRVQGLAGWPSHWTDLVEVDVAALSGDQRAHTIAIPADQQAPFAAYRIVILKTRGDQPARLQQIVPLKP